MPKTVMIVDDSASIRQVVNLTLRKVGYDVIEASDGQDALRKLANVKVNLLICDVNMPNMDGITLLKSLKALPNYKYVPVIMLTTESQEAKKQEGKAAGAKAWVVKPFKPEQMLEAVSKLIVQQNAAG
ncbi:MAG: response regulator [Deltaproteobacteria bacterium]|nr:response regulator [Deltaproteobacteria bacterium]